MSDNSGKKKAKKPAQEGVLGTLPATRPARVGRARTASASPARSSAAKAAPATKSVPPRAAAAKPARPKPAQPRTPKPPEPPPRRDGPPSGADLAVTAARAVGELAQIGATVGAQVLKRAASRLPRP